MFILGINVCEERKDPSYGFKASEEEDELLAKARQRQGRKQEAEGGKPDETHFREGERINGMNYKLYAELIQSARKKEGKKLRKRGTDTQGRL